MPTFDPERLAQLDFFQHIEKRVLHQLASRLQRLTLKEGETLFRQGDLSNEMYVLLSGQLYAFFEHEGHLKYFGKISQGETVGEMGFLGGQPRSLTIQSITNSEVLALDKPAFEMILRSTPESARFMMAGMIQRSRQALKILQKGWARESQLVVLAPANPSVNMESTIRLLKDRHNTDILLIGVSLLTRLYQEGGDSTIISRLIEAQSQYKLIICPVETLQSMPEQLILRWADMLCILAEGTASPAYETSLLEILKNNKLRNIRELPIRKTLLLKWPPHVTIRNTRAWLQNLFETHYHLQHEKKDADRLLRFWSGKATGLVLSGGASRGWAHLGVLQAIQEKEIIIDSIAGTSIGAIAAACFLVKQGNLTDTIDLMKQINLAFLQDISFSSIILPVISFYSGSHVIRALQTHFAKLHIEDLSIPFFSMGTLVPANCEIRFESGKLWKAVRGSAALPGFFPPLLHKGKLIYDGGLTNNLPVDHMRKKLGPEATIIASHITVATHNETAYYFPDIWTFWKTLLYRTGFLKKYKVPPFLATFIEALLAGSYEKSIQNAKQASYCVNLTFSNQKLISFKPVETTFIHHGYEKALAALSRPAACPKDDDNTTF